MVNVLAEVQIEDYAKFIAVFTTQGKRMRVKHGCLRSQVYRADDPHTIYLVFDWESREAFDGFVNDPEVKATMASSGSKPTRFSVLEKVCEIPG